MAMVAMGGNGWEFMKKKLQFQSFLRGLTIDSRLNLPADLFIYSYVFNVNILKTVLIRL